MKTVIISAATFVVLSVCQYVIFDSGILQTLSDEDATIQANEFMDNLCVATNQRVVTFPNYQRVPDYSIVYNCEGL